MAMGKKNLVYYINVIIYFAITFGIGFLPPFGQITELGMKVLGVFIGVIYGWITLGLTWPSLFSMIALSLVGYTNITAAFSSGMSYYLVPILFITFIFAAAVGKTGITEWLAEWLMSRKIIIGRPLALIAVLLIGIEVLAILNAGFVGLIMIWSMTVTLAEKAGMPKHNSFVSFMIPALTVIYVIAGFIMPFAQGSVMYLGFFEQGYGSAFPQIGYIVWHLIIVNLYILLLLLVVRFMLRIDLRGIKMALEDYEGKQCPKMNKNQVFGFILLLTYLILLLLPIFLPNEWSLISLINQMGVLGIGTILTIILLLYRNSDGSPLVTITEASDGIAWDVIWLIIATTPLAAAFNSADCGIMATIMGFLTPILTSMSPMLFIIACSLLLGITSQFVHNLVLAIVFIPILVPLCAQMGGDPYACYLAIYFALTMAFATPAASMNAALVFGHSSLTPKDGYLNGIMHFVLAMLLVLIVGMPLAHILF